MDGLWWIAFFAVAICAFKQKRKLKSASQTCLHFLVPNVTGTNEVQNEWRNYWQGSLWDQPSQHVLSCVEHWRFWLVPSRSEILWGLNDLVILITHLSNGLVWGQKGIFRFQCANRKHFFVNHSLCAHLQSSLNCFFIRIHWDSHCWSWLVLIAIGQSASGNCFLALSWYSAARALATVSLSNSIIFILVTDIRFSFNNFPNS